MSHSAEEKRKTNVKFKPIAETLQEPFSKDFPYIIDGLVRGEPGDFVLAPTYGENADNLYNFHVRSDDVWILSFPKCGTTWTQEMVWLVTHDCDFDGAEELLNQRSCFFEFPTILPRGSGVDLSFVKHISEHIEILNQLKFPRNLKSHLPLYLLSPDVLSTSKIVYVARNPKDVMVSYFHHHKLIKASHFAGDFESFARYFMNDLVLYAPFFAHILELWSLRNHPNVLFLFYEDMKKDLRNEVEKVVRFFGKSFSDEQVERLTNHLKFENLSKNQSVNKDELKKLGESHVDQNFMRKGETGDWKNYFNPQLTLEVDNWIKKNLSGTDLKFTEEL